MPGDEAICALSCAAGQSHAFSSSACAERKAYENIWLYLASTMTKFCSRSSILFNRKIVVRNDLEGLKSQNFPSEGGACPQTPLNLMATALIIDVGTLL